MYKGKLKEFVERKRKHLPIIWTIKWIASSTDAILTFTPRCFQGDPCLEAGILKAAGIRPVECKLPEPAITLPRAPWDESYAYDGGSGMIEETETMFLSEAQGRIRAHVQDLLRLAGLPMYEPETLELLESAYYHETGGFPVPAQ